VGRDDKKKKITVLGINQGASVIIRSTFDWNRSSISSLELDDVQNSNKFVVCIFGLVSILLTGGSILGPS
jgi:hypothetical protein